MFEATKGMQREHFDSIHVVAPTNRDEMVPELMDQQNQKVG